MNEVDLHQLIESGDLQQIQNAIDIGVDVNQLSAEGTTFLVESVELGKLEIVKALIQAGADINHGGIFSPLHIACSEGNLEIVKLLLENGAYVDILDEEGSTPLMWAASSGNLEIVRCLIEFGADLDLRDDTCRTAFNFAAEKNNNDVIGYFLSLDDSNNYACLLEPTRTRSLNPGILPNAISVEFVRAVKDGQIAQANEFIAQGIDINATDLSGNTALFWASLRGHLDLVKLLISSKADVNAGGNRPPISAAAEKGNIAIIKELLEAGAIMDQKDSSGCLPITYAQERGFWWVVDFLQQWKSENFQQ